MHSKKLKQNITLALEQLAGRGEPVTRREVVEFVELVSSDDHWCEQDRRDARYGYYLSAVTDEMKTPVSQETLDRLMPNVPREYLPLLFGLESWICVSPKPGPDSRHMMSLLATADHWAANARLKMTMAERTAARADQSKDALRLIREKGITRLADLGQRIDA